ATTTEGREPKTDSFPGFALITLRSAPQAIASIDQGSGDPDSDRRDWMSDQSRKHGAQRADDHESDRDGEHDPGLDGLERPLIGDRRADRVADAKQASGGPPGASSASRGRRILLAGESPDHGSLVQNDLGGVRQILDVHRFHQASERVVLDAV